jgi:hypothetical protein
MSSLNQQLLDLFHASDGLLMPDEFALQEISIKQDILKAWNEEMVLQGLISMKEQIQNLAGQNKSSLMDFMDELDWELPEQASSLFSKTNPKFPSWWELTRTLSNWVTVFIPPVRTLDLPDDWELIKCLAQEDHFISTLAVIMLEDEEFNFLGCVERYQEMLNTRRDTILRLELGRLMFTRYDDPQVLENESVPNLISSHDKYQAIITSREHRKRLFEYIRKLVVWDIATEGDGPHEKWPFWWV